MSRREAEFGEFVAARRAPLFRTARLLAAGDDHHAEDLVQAALERLYVAWPRVRAEDGPEAYVRRVLVNLAIDDSRRPWRRVSLRADVPDVTQVPDRRGPDGQPHDERDAVRSALAQLPPRMRAAVVLRHWLECDVRETAALLGCSEGTVKSQTARGLALLRERLASVAPNR